MRRPLSLREPTDLQNYFTEREISRRFSPGVALEPLSTPVRQVYCHFSLTHNTAGPPFFCVLYFETHACTYIQTKEMSLISHLREMLTCQPDFNFAIESCTQRVSHSQYCFY